MNSDKNPENKKVRTKKITSQMREMGRDLSDLKKEKLGMNYYRVCSGRKLNNSIEFSNYYLRIEMKE